MFAKLCLENNLLLQILSSNFLLMLSSDYNQYFVMAFVATYFVVCGYILLVARIKGEKEFYFLVPFVSAQFNETLDLPVVAIDRAET